MNTFITILGRIIACLSSFFMVLPMLLILIPLCGLLLITVVPLYMIYIMYELILYVFFPNKYMSNDELNSQEDSEELNEEKHEQSL